MKNNGNRICQVVSKYFVKEATMEDSFDDFQDKKKIKTGPKIVPKDKKNKKSLKRSKGQKDISSLIKKSELISYSQDFDQVCKQNGVDVDSEQLQLAIALSKSLNEIRSCSEDVEIENKQISSEERTAKIRTTLQEYGFKVNKNKILLSIPTNKRKKKYKNHSKLLQISSEQRQQEISNKYFEVLSSNSCKSPNEKTNCIYSKHAIFYKATNIPYENIKSNDLFYVNDLVEKPTHKTCLLRDWSEIPGRPVSPKPIHNDFNFEAMQFSQDKLDDILSGSIDKAQNIVNSKQYVRENKNIKADLSKDNTCIHNNTIDIIEPILSCSNNSKNNQSQVSQVSHTDKVSEEQVDIIQDIENSSSPKKNIIQENIESFDLIKSRSSNINLQNSLKVFDLQNSNFQFRSASPDLFDDEVCSIIENKNDYSTETNKVSSIIENKNHNTRENGIKYDSCTIFMDLTECANDIYSINVHNTNLTKRKSNDLMDITECVKSKSNTGDVILGEANEDNAVRENEELIDLTQLPNLVYYSPEKKKSGTTTVSIDIDDTIIYDNVVFKKTVNENIDLQESVVLCDEESITKDVMNGMKSKDDDMPNSNHISCKPDNNDINIDLTQGSEQRGESINYPEYQYDDFRSEILDYNSDTLNNDNDKDNDIISLKSVSFNNDFENQDEDIDLTQDSEKSFGMPEENYVINCPETSYKGLKNCDYNASTIDNKNDSILSVNNMEDNDFENQDEDIDLTQDSEKSFGMPEENYVINCPETSYKGLKNCDYNASTIDNKNDSILSVNNMEDIHKLVEENKDDKIDLTQVTEEIEGKSSASGYVYKNNSKLGKIDNISIDYDEMFDEIASETNVYNHISKSNISNKENNVSNPSINSEVFEISDKELNYSIHHSIQDNFNFKETSVSRNRSLSDSYVPTVISKPLTPIKEKNRSQSNTPIKVNRDISDAIIQTPKNNDYIIKTREVTPMADYETMTSPERNKELEKYGLKPFKRKRAIQLLTYVYNQTHPVIESCSPEEGPSKRLKINNNKYKSPNKKLKSPKKCLDFGSDINKENDIFVVTNETPDIKNIECDPNEWVFQNREKAKVHSCRVPLHIAFHNYVSSRRLLREAILRYEPVNIDIIHKDLVSYGHKYNPKDLLKFLDRKCITVKIVENNLRNKKA